MISIVFLCARLPSYIQYYTIVYGLQFFKFKNKRSVIRIKKKQIIIVINKNVIQKKN